MRSSIGYWCACVLCAYCVTNQEIDNTSRPQVKHAKSITMGWKLVKTLYESKPRSVCVVGKTSSNESRVVSKRINENIQNARAPRNASGIEDPMLKRWTRQYTVFTWTSVHRTQKYIIKLLSWCLWAELTWSNKVIHKRAKRAWQLTHVTSITNIWSKIQSHRNEAFGRFIVVTNKQNHQKLVLWYRCSQTEQTRIPSRLQHNTAPTWRPLKRRYFAKTVRTLKQLLYIQKWLQDKKFTVKV